MEGRSGKRRVIRCTKDLAARLPLFGGLTGRQMVAGWAQSRPIRFEGLEYVVSVRRTPSMHAADGFSPFAGAGLFPASLRVLMGIHA